MSQRYWLTWYWLTVWGKYHVTLKSKIWTKNDLNCARNKSMNLMNDLLLLSIRAVVHEYSFLFEPRKLEFRLIKRKPDFSYFVNIKFIWMFIWVCCDLIYAVALVQFNARRFICNEILDYVFKSVLICPFPLNSRISSYLIGCNLLYFSEDEPTCLFW